MREAKKRKQARDRLTKNWKDAKRAKKKERQGKITPRTGGK